MSGGKAARRKGHDFERKVAAMFREAGYSNARRGRQTRSGSDEADVEETPFWIECKIGKTQPSPVAAYGQALNACRDRRTILVVTKKDFCKPEVWMCHSDMIYSGRWYSRAWDHDTKRYMVHMPLKTFLEEFPGND